MRNFHDRSRKKMMRNEMKLNEKEKEIGVKRKELKMGAKCGDDDRKYRKIVRRKKAEEREVRVFRSKVELSLSTIQRECVCDSFFFCLDTAELGIVPL